MNAFVFLQMLNCGSLISDCPAFASKSRTHRILISLHKPPMFHLFSLDGAGSTQTSFLRVSTRARASLLGFHISPYFLLWEIHCFSIKASHFTL